MSGDHRHRPNARPPRGPAEVGADAVVVIGSFSKQFAITGWRCGYLIANAELPGLTPQQILMAALVAHNGEAKTEEWAKGIVANFARAPF